MESNKGYTLAIAEKLRNEIKKVIINQEDLTNYAITALFTGGHVLLEGLPGLAKTLWVRTLAKAMNLDFKRTQFTSDLMPSDIIGTKIFDVKTSEFEVKKGPLFTNLFLADELNRTPPKTQSALLEVMEERSITIGNETHLLSEPFMVFATQNPLEFEGTYPLPEALLDRFMMKLIVGYPGVTGEKNILSMYNEGFSGIKLDNINPVCSKEDFRLCRDEIKEVKVDDTILNYIVSIVETTRRVSAVAIGASPRGSISLLLNAKTLAAVNGRDFVIPDDIKELAVPILRHRIILKPEAEIDGLKTDKVIENILMQVKVPR